MCGILGSVNNSRQLDISKIEHRGPDGSGMYQQDNVQLGHVRLSIIDLSASGDQPFFSDDERYVMVYNGEVYNHEDLKSDLIEKGHKFHSSSDTETVLKAYIEWGSDFLVKLNGIFALAIYDRLEKRLLLARDRFGVKPFYYSLNHGELLFSSELKGISSMSNEQSELDEFGLSNYIRFLWSAGETTPVKGVKKLLPGHFIEVETSSSELHVKQGRFYTAEFNGKYNEDESALIDELDQLLTAAVERQLLSDVPVGFFLSGGLDSSLIVAIARKLRPEGRIQCFTIDTTDFGKSEGFSDDLHYAKLVSDYLDVDLEIVNAKPDILGDFDKMIWYLDEPQADPAPLNVLNISRRAREMGYTVLLGGAGGDDVFSGYRRHQALRLEGLLNLIPRPVRILGSKFSEILPSTKPSYRRLKKVFKNSKYRSADRLIGYFEWLAWEDAYKLFTPELRKSLGKRDSFEFFKSKLSEIPLEKNSLNKMLHLEMSTFLVDHNLNYTDKMGMAAGVEIRVPFLDNDLVSFSYKVHPSLKLNQNETKYILKKVAERYLPNEVIYRSKAGFGAPVRQWITAELKDKIAIQLSKERLKEQGIFDPNEVWRLIEDNEAGRVDASYSIWALLAIQSWIDQFYTR